MLYLDEMVKLYFQSKKNILTGISAFLGPTLGAILCNARDLVNYYSMVFIELKTFSGPGLERHARAR